MSEELAIYQARPIERDLIERDLIERAAPTERDLIALLLDDKRSDCTKRAYAGDLRDFFAPNFEESAVRAFCALPVPEIALALSRYKNALRARELSEATINRRLAAVRSLLKFAHRLGYAATDGRGLVEGEKTKSYRDTRGVDVATLRKLLAAPLKKFGPQGEKSEKSRACINNGIGQYISLPNVDIYARDAARDAAREQNRNVHLLRDLAILHLLIENALRRAEVCKPNVGDFDASARSLWILGKGRGQQKERVTLSPDCAASLSAYLVASGHQLDTPGPLFRNLDPRPEFRGGRLTPDGLYSLVGDYGRFVGLSRLTPHQLRHSAITAALDATGGDVRKVQKLSRHAKLDTLLIYDDNRADVQGEMSSLLSGLLSGKKKSRTH